jgi:hypothetical protein
VLFGKVEDGLRVGADDIAPGIIIAIDHAT